MKKNKHNVISLTLLFLYFNFNTPSNIKDSIFVKCKSFFKNLKTLWTNQNQYRYTQLVEENKELHSPVLKSISIKKKSNGGNSLVDIIKKQCNKNNFIENDKDYFFYTHNIIEEIEETKKEIEKDFNIKNKNYSTHEDEFYSILKINLLNHSQLHYINIIKIACFALNNIESIIKKNDDYYFDTSFNFIFNNELEDIPISFNKKFSLNEINEGFDFSQKSFDPKIQGLSIHYDEKNYILYSLILIPSNFQFKEFLDIVHKFFINYIQSNYCFFKCAFADSTTLKEILSCCPLISEMLAKTMKFCRGYKEEENNKFSIGTNSYLIIQKENVSNKT